METFHISTGIRGGIAGGIAMIVPATIFSVLKYHSLWYAMNLLAAGGFQSWAGQSDAFLGQFHLQGLLAGALIQGFVSLLVGLLYGAMLPMFPRYPILTAGFMAPLLFTGIVYSALGIVSPILNQRIEWFWFVASQVSFGLVCGYVVNLQAKVRTPQFQALPFRLRSHLLTEGRGGIDLDEVEDPCHRRLEVLNEVLVADHAKVPFRHEPGRVRLVELAEHRARGLVEVLEPPPLVLLPRAVPDVVPVLEHAGE